MAAESRTTKSIKNSQVAILYYCLNLVLTFFSRQVFIKHLGAEVLGLNTTATNLLGFLNLAELGISAAISFSLYKPLAENDRTAVNDIVSVQGWLYRRIAWIVIGASAVLMCFFLLIFAKADVPLWYAYASFGVLLFASLSGYFFNYRQIVITADQRNYRLLMITHSVKNGKALLQILAVAFLPHGYVWWLGLEFVASVVTIFGINKLLKHHYPWLDTNVSAGGRLRRKYPQIVIKTKQLFFHKIASFATSYTSPLVIYGFASLTVVTIYDNYMFLVLGITALLNAMLNGITAGVGNLLATADREKEVRFFGELFSFNFLIACVACTAMWLLAPALIELWVGSKFLLDDVSLGLIVAILYVYITRGVVDTFIRASGLFHDIWSCVIEAAINLGVSILLGWLFGLPGILSGVLLSLLIILKGWKPYFLFSQYLQTPIRHYIVIYARHLGALAMALTVFVPLAGMVRLDPATSWGNLALCGVMVCVGFTTLLGGAMWLTTRGMKDLVARGMQLINRINKNDTK